MNRDHQTETTMANATGWHRNCDRPSMAQTTAQKHTPGPITFSRWNDGLESFRLVANDFIIADVLFKRTFQHAPIEAEALANAARLTHCWNCHDELLEALKALLHAIPLQPGMIGYEQDQQARTAIQKASNHDH